MFVATSPSHRHPLALVERPSRALEAGEARVAVRAIGVNPVDWKMREGGPIRMAHRFLGPRGPLVVGIDFAGEVVESRAPELAVGARVVGGTDFTRNQLGSYATEVVTRADQCVVLPEAVSFDAAACLPVPGVTAWIALTEHAKVKAGDKVLILGASGGVGLLAIQLARVLGCHPVGVCSSRNKALVERLGATAVDYTAGDALEAAAKHGRYRLILHAVGTDTYPLSKCRALLAPGGVVDLAVVRPVDVASIAFRSSVVTMLGRVTRERLAPIVAALAEGRIETIVEATYPLASAEEAHARSRGGKVVGKLLLHP